MSKTTIPTGGITADAINGTLIADDAVSEEHLDATALTGNAALAETPADTDEVLISDGGTLKRIDFSYLKASNTPSFRAKTSSTQTFSSSDGYKKVQYDSEDWDTDSVYDHSSNYRFTVPSNQAGKYNITIMHRQNGTSAQGIQYSIVIYKNGSGYRYFNANPSYGGDVTRYGVVYTETLSLSATDYLEIYINGDGFELGAGNGIFMVHKLIGV
jgi:hypothetical protein